MKVLILCGGLGTRAYPFTRTLPKALLPVGGIPVVEQVMRIYAAQGYDRFVLAAGHMKDAIDSYFRTRRQWNVRCVDTGDGADTGERVRRSLDHIGGEAFHLTYCDGLGDVDLQALVARHRDHGARATLTAVPLRSQYGVVRADAADLVTDFAEKPVLEGMWVNAGFMVLEPDALDGLEGASLERDLLPAMAGAGRLGLYRHRGFWRSLDTFKDQQELDREWPAVAASHIGVHSSLQPLPAWLAARYAVVERELA